MDNGVNVTDAGTLAALRGVGIGGYGYGQQYAPNAAIRADVRGNRDINLLEAINRGSSDQFLSQKITDGQSSLTNTITAGDNFLSEQMRERSVADRFSSLERQLFAFQNDSQRDTANLNNKVTECCCKLEAGQAAILAKLDAQALQAAQTENLNLRIQMSQGQVQGN